MSTARPPAAAARSDVSVAALVLSIAALLIAASALAWVVTRDNTESVAEEGSGVAVEDVRHVDPFTSVELSGATELKIGVGGDRRVVEQITTEVNGGVLVVDQTGESLDSLTPTNVEITVPSLEGLILSGVGTIQVDGHELDALNVELSGTGTITGVGTVTTLDVDLAGLGDVDLGEFVARDATVVLSGAGTVQVHVTGALEARVPGSGTITYVGDPDTVDQEVTGSGSVMRD